MERTLAREAEGGSAITEIFRAGRYLRILDQEGRFGYGIITGVNPDVARTLVNLNADLQGITALRTLKEGLQHCIRYLSGD